MFSGIVQALCSIAFVAQQAGVMHYGVLLSDDLTANLKPGASIAIDGVCQTVVTIEGNVVTFDAIGETLFRTTIKHLQQGDRVNVERSLGFGDEVGGHLVSGHVFEVAKIEYIDRANGQYIVHFRASPEATKYLFPKGYVALDGCSLTLVDVNPEGTFTVHLIPETLRRTTFGYKNVGDGVNLEFDSATVAIVRTVESYLERKAAEMPK